MMMLGKNYLPSNDWEDLGCAEHAAFLLRRDWSDV
jgi:hypothetical protein